MYFDDFGEFLAAAVNRYSGPPYNVRHFEIWNEPDIDPDLVPGDSLFGCWGDSDDDLYGGTARNDDAHIAKIFGTQLHAGSKTGYLHQLLAGLGWTSLFALPAIRQPALIVAGTDDPIIPIINAHIMTRLLPHATLHPHPGGHIDLVTNAGQLAPVIATFLHTPGERP